MLLTRRIPFEVRVMRRLRAQLIAAGWPPTDAEEHAIDAVDRARRVLRRSWNRLAKDFYDDAPKTVLHRLMWPAYREAHRIVSAREALK